MKALITSAIVSLSPFTFANTEAQLIETLESHLRFSGYVEIEKVTIVDAYSIVEFYVGSYGEERATTCVLRYEKLVDCKDNWFTIE